MPLSKSQRLGLWELHVCMVSPSVGLWGRKGSGDTFWEGFLFPTGMLVALHLPPCVLAPEGRIQLCMWLFGPKEGCPGRGLPRCHLHGCREALGPKK